MSKKIKRKLRDLEASVERLNSVSADLWVISAELSARINTVREPAPQGSVDIITDKEATASV